jgi:hypothetical protein
MRVIDFMYEIALLYSSRALKAKKKRKKLDKAHEAYQ